MAQENKSWGYDRIAGALANLGHQVSDQTIGNILKRHGIAPAPKRSQSTSWKDFIAAHMAVLAGIDFFTVEVLTWRGLATYYVLFFIHLESRRVNLCGITKHPTEEWMLQIGRNATDESSGILKECRHVLHDRDAKFTESFRLDGRWRSTVETTATQSQSECVRGTLGAIRQAGVLGQADPVRRSLTEACASRI